LIIESEPDELVFFENEKLKAYTIDCGVVSSDDDITYWVISRQLELHPLSKCSKDGEVMSKLLRSGKAFYFCSLY